LSAISTELAREPRRGQEAAPIPASARVEEPAPPRHELKPSPVDSVVAPAPEPPRPAPPSVAAVAPAVPIVAEPVKPAPSSPGPSQPRPSAAADAVATQ